MSPTNSEERKQKARLLCVDDDLHFLAVFTAVLETAGYNVVATNDPRQALTLATTEGFDLVILDYDMPYMNGAELARQLKQDESDLPIILLSGHPSLPADEFAAVDEHVLKGESIELLLQVLSARVRPVTQLTQRHGKSRVR